jgi:hypothetical protein
MASTAMTLEGRLLCASGCAYAVIDGESTLDPEGASPFYDGVGYANPPAAFLVGPDEINACIVGTTGDGVVVAFRGTLPLDGPFTWPLLMDWVNDFYAEPKAGDGLPGMVHEGFLDSLDSLWTDVLDETTRQLAAAPGKSLLITGHSKGGAIATLAAMRFLKLEGLTSKVITFAAPKPGDADFTTAYNAVMDHTRFEYAEDVVPHLPPSADFLEVLKTVSFFERHLPDLQDYDYERVGTLKYIDRSGAIATNPPDSDLPARRQRIIDLALSGHIQQIGDDHKMACGYGYMTTLCPTGVCPVPLAGPTPGGAPRSAT